MKLEYNGKRELCSLSCLLKPFVSLFYFYLQIFFIYKMKRIYYDLVFFASLHLFYRTEINFEDSSPQVLYQNIKKQGLIWVSQSST